MFPNKQDPPGGPAIGNMYWIHVLPTSLSVLQHMTAADLSKAYWTVGMCSFIYRYYVIIFFPSKLCTPLSIPSKMLDAKSPQGTCQSLLNTLCTLLLILHCCDSTVGEMQMAAHGIALWGNKGNTAYFSNAGFIFPALIEFFAFFAVWTTSVLHLTCLRHSFPIGRIFTHDLHDSPNFKKNERWTFLAGQYFQQK